MGIDMPLSADGRFIVDAHGRRARLAGVNWYGAHEDLGLAPGLERIHRTRLARTIARHGFNSARLPFSLWMTGQSSPVPQEYLAANPDLYGATPMQVYDDCVEALTGAGLIVIPNCHTLDPGWCWCWWALNPTQPKGTIPVTGQHRSNWGDPEGYGLLAPDWRGVANPRVLDILKAMIPPRAGPGVS